MIKNFIERKSLSAGATDDNFENLLHSQVIQETDYMSLFFEEERKKSELRKNIESKLNALAYEELKKMAATALSSSFSILKQWNEITGLEDDREAIKFNIAACWHLSDAVHNLPSCLNNEKEESKLTSFYLSEYFTVVLNIEEIISSKHLSKHSRFHISSALHRQYTELWKENENSKFK